MAKYLRRAQVAMPELRRAHISPHTMRHTKAMHLLEAGLPLITIKDFLGHVDVKTTEIYVRADPTAKLEAIDAVLPPGLRRGRFKAPDKLLASLRPARKGY